MIFMTAASSGYYRCDAMLTCLHVAINTFYHVGMLTCEHAKPPRLFRLFGCFLGVMLLVVPINSNPKQEEQTMGREFCKGRTQNQLNAAFSQAHMDAQSAIKAAREAVALH